MPTLPIPHRHPIPGPVSTDQEAGTSMVEVLIAMVAATVLLGSVISTAIRINGQRRADQELNLAFVAASNNLEELRAVDYADLPGLNGSGFDVPGVNGAPGGLQAQDGDADGLPGLLTVTVD